MVAVYFFRVFYNLVYTSNYTSGGDPNDETILLFTHSLTDLFFFVTNLKRKFF